MYFVKETSNYINQVESDRYFLVAKDALKLDLVIESLKATGHNDLYSGAIEADDTSAINEKLVKFVTYYNRLKQDVVELGGTIGSAYGQKLQAYLNNEKIALEYIGIYIQEDGSLSIDEQINRKVNPEQVKRLYGNEQSMARYMSSVLEDINDVIYRVGNDSHTRSSNFSVSKFFAGTYNKSYKK